MNRVRVIMLLGLSLAIALLAVGISSAPAGGGRTIQVHPGELQAAIARAQAGDTLVIHQGRYRGSLVIDKQLSLIGAKGEKRPVIDGQCQTRVTISVREPGVLLRRLHVVGASQGSGSSEVEFSFVASGRATHLLVRDTCDAEYGINVFGSREVDVIENRGRGFSDAAFYVGSISSTGDGVLRVARNIGFANNRGIIVEEIEESRIRVVDNVLSNNTAPGLGPPTGIFLHIADGVVLLDNRVRDNGRFGIHLDPSSDGNRLFDNVALRNPSGNIRNEGTGNCGARNRPNALPPC